MLKTFLKNKSNLKNADPKYTGLSSDNKVFINKSLCSYYKKLWSLCKKLKLDNYLSSFWVSKDPIKLKLSDSSPTSIISLEFRFT